MKAANTRDTDYSTNKVSQTLLNDIKEALKSVDSYGSVELFVQDNKVTQITTRNIQKTEHKNGKVI